MKGEIMGKVIYNKLVRDRIPELIKKDGKRCEYVELRNDEMFLPHLTDKLIEEVLELKRARSRESILEELADIHTILDCIASIYNVTGDRLISASIKKHSEKGGFDKRIVLLEVTDGMGG